eukprot:47659_1
MSTYSYSYCYICNCYKWYIIAEYNNKTRKIYGEQCKKSLENLVKCIRMTFSIDENQELDVKIYNKKQNKYFNIDKNEVNMIPDGAAICVKKKAKISQDTKTKIMEQIINKIVKASSCLLSKTILITPETDIDINNGRFIIRLDFEYKEWISNSKKYEGLFKHEICQTVPWIKPSMIQIQQVNEGSVIIKFRVIIDWITVNIWMCRFPSMKSTIPQYKMKCQDQIEVYFQGKWYSSTIIEIRSISSLGNGGKYFKVRYNAVNGRDIFWRNTEWFRTRCEKNSLRLRFPGQHVPIYVNGKKCSEEWNPPGIAIDKQGVRANNVYELKVGHHIFVYSQSAGDWYRCEIVKRCIDIRKKLKEDFVEHISIRVIRLVDGELSGFFLDLWKPEHRELIAIRLEDMRVLRDENAN